MDRAYESDPAHQCLEKWGFQLVVPPKSSRLKPWEYDKIIYERRNEVERLFRMLKAFWRVLSRFEKLDLMFNAFIHIALINDMIN